MSNPTVIQMIRATLKAGDYTGLVSADAECGCRLDDLAPCGQTGLNCEAGHVVNDSDQGFRVRTVKP